MHYVYLLRSLAYPEQTYAGYTSDLKARLFKHNEGGCPHTSKYKPWECKWYCGFQDKYKALKFEEYLKSHLGKAFASKHLW